MFKKRIIKCYLKQKKDNMNIENIEECKILIIHRKQFYVFHPKIKVVVLNRKYVFEYNKPLEISVLKGMQTIILTKMYQKVIVELNVQEDTVLELYTNRYNGMLNASAQPQTDISVSKNMIQIIINIASILLLIFALVLWLNRFIFRFL